MAFSISLSLQHIQSTHNHFVKIFLVKARQHQQRIYFYLCFNQNQHYKPPRCCIYLMYVEEHQSTSKIHTKKHALCREITYNMLWWFLLLFIETDVESTHFVAFVCVRINYIYVYARTTRRGSLRRKNTDSPR